MTDDLHARLSQEPRLSARLDELSDEELREIVQRGQQLLDRRAEQRQRAAVAEIRKIARAHGLDVAVKGPRKRRGRPPKEDAS